MRLLLARGFCAQAGTSADLGAIWGLSRSHLGQSRGPCAQVDASNKYSQTPLHLAARLGVPAAAALLLEAGDQDTSQDTSETPPSNRRHVTRHPGDTFEQRWRKLFGRFRGFLPQAGASLLVRDERGQTPLQVARARGHATVVDVLLAAAAAARPQLPLPPPRALNPHAQAFVPAGRVAEGSGGAATPAKQGRLARGRGRGRGAGWGRGGPAGRRGRRQPQPVMG